MTQKVDDPEVKKRPPIPVVNLPRIKHTHLTRAGIISLLVLIVLLLVSMTGLLIYNITQGTLPIALSRNVQTQQIAPAAAQTATSNLKPGGTSISPLTMPNNVTPSSLQLPTGKYVIYEQQNAVYLVSSAGGQPQAITTPGYLYSQSARPILTPSDQLLYTGDGIWLTGIFDGNATQIVTLAAGQAVTSLALSKDGTTIAWTVEPVDGKGNIDLYIGPLGGNGTLVYEQSAATCPCFSIFSFINAPAQSGNSLLLLTDDRGSHEAVQHGLWILDVTMSPPVTPTLILNEDPQQGPLALSPNSDMLLYSTSEGVIPVPTDQSVPADIASLPYANSLTLTTMNGQAITLGTPQVVLPEQRSLNNSADYHWVTTPMFSLDGKTLIYVEFSSDAQAPFDRHSALYMARLTKSSAGLQVGKPELLATSSALLLELGQWLSKDMLTFYGDGTVYAMNIQTGAVAQIVQTGTYARVLAVVGMG